VKTPNYISIFDRYVFLFYLFFVDNGSLRYVRYHTKMASKEQGVDLQRSASKSAENGDPQIRAILDTLLKAAKQPPRTRIRLDINDIYFLLDKGKYIYFCS
jgi:hypothetical protein